MLMQIQAHDPADDIGVLITVPREYGFQNRLENFNGRWQTKVWGRFRHDSLPALQA
jgi:hypothetical protein